MRAKERPAALRFGLAFLVAAVLLVWSTDWLRTEGSSSAVPTATLIESSPPGANALVARGVLESANGTLPSDVEAAPGAERPAATPSRSRDERTFSDRYPSSLEVESAVPAVVWLGDQRLGVAPGRFSPVPPGRHELRIEASDGRVFSKNVIVTPGSTTYVRARALSP